jgi:stage II sporulation protein R
MWAKVVLAGVMSFGFLWPSVPVNLPSPAAAQTAVKPITPPPVIRFRVIANSDNPVDQAVKLDVRDALLQGLDPLLGKATNAKQAARIIRTRLPWLTQRADHVLASHDVVYKAHIELAETQFPTKVYGSWVLPAGTYKALLVVLGQGHGHNWWCVLFPSLCFIDMSNAVAIPASDAVKASDAMPPAIPSNPISVPAVPVHVPAPVPQSAHGHIHVTWKLPEVVNHLLAWI